MQLSSVITIVVALIAAIAAIVAPVVSAVITQRGARKLKATELFFGEKVEAFKGYLVAADEYMKEFSSENISSLNLASSNAFLFSSQETQAAISAFGSKLGACHTTNWSPSDSMELANSRYKMILAMQNDLKE